MAAEMECPEKAHPCKNRKDGPPNFKGKVFCRASESAQKV